MDPMAGYHWARRSWRTNEHYSYNGYALKTRVDNGDERPLYQNGFRQPYLGYTSASQVTDSNA
jgi:hypothetical protein